jgi:hypothetical protein
MSDRRRRRALPRWLVLRFPYTPVFLIVAGSIDGTALEGLSRSAEGLDSAEEISLGLRGIAGDPA